MATRSARPTWPGTRALHLYVMTPPEGMEVDHADRDKLNNTRANLRAATSSQQKMNRDYPVGETGYRGVAARTRAGGEPFYQGRIHIGGRCISLGSFATPHDAARAFDAYCAVYYGEFGVPNFPDETPWTFEHVERVKAAAAVRPLTAEPAHVRIDALLSP